jgi:hypothetical protein
MEQQYRSNLYNNTSTVIINDIVKRVVSSIKRPLKRAEYDEVITFMNKIDPHLLTLNNINKTKSVMVKTLIEEFKKFSCGFDATSDTHTVLNNIIGISSESGTTHSIYDDRLYDVQAQYNVKPSTHVTKAYEPDDDSAITQLPIGNSVDKRPETEYEEDFLENLVETQPAVRTPAPQPLQNQQPVSYAPFQTTYQKPPVESPLASIKNILGVNRLSDAVRKFNPQSLVRRNYILLDSRYRIITSLSANGGVPSFSWNYIVNSQQTAQGTANIVGNIRDIIGIRAYPFRIPYVSNADNRYSRVTMLINELGSQSFIAHENRKFHFMFQSTIDSDFIDLSTDNQNDGYFWFEKPITTLDTITVTFGSPLEAITFDGDRDTCTIDYFTIAPLTQITTQTEHNLNNGDRVYFSNFDLGAVNPILVDQVTINNNIKRTINRESGFLITTIDDFNFSISFDSSLIQNPIANLLFNVYYGSKRLFIPLELTYITPE